MGGVKKNVKGGGTRKDNSLRLERTTTDEVHDLQFVAVFDKSLGPLGALHDVAIQFYGYAVRLHAELLYEMSERIHALERAFIPIDDELDQSG